MLRPLNANARRRQPSGGGTETAGLGVVSTRELTTIHARRQTADLAALTAAAESSKAAGDHDLYWTLRREFLLAQVRDYEARHESR